MPTQSKTRAYNTGVIAGMLVSAAVALITGVILLPAYKAETATAYASASQIAASGFLGFVRNVHHWSSAVLIVLGEIHLITGLFRGAYKKPGQWLWVGSIALFLLGLLMQITGHLLPLDVQA